MCDSVLYFFFFASHPRYYVTINDDSTIGIHKDWTEYLPGGGAGFPENVDCMIAGLITYVMP